jgi:mannosyl-oligosaccharide alpha-1,2-mannosidase
MTDDVSVGALGDSFYEYLLKGWVYKGSKDASGRVPFDDAMRVRHRLSFVLTSQTIKEKLTFKSQPSQLLYIGEGRGMGVQHKMGHLACFIGGLFSLATKNAPPNLVATYTEVCPPDSLCLM